MFGFFLNKCVWLSTYNRASVKIYISTEDKMYETEHKPAWWDSCFDECLVLLGGKQILSVSFLLERVQLVFFRLLQEKYFVAINVSLTCVFLFMLRLRLLQYTGIDHKGDILNMKYWSHFSNTYIAYIFNHFHFSHSHVFSHCVISLFVHFCTVMVTYSLHIHTHIFWNWKSDVVTSPVSYLQKKLQEFFILHLILNSLYFV